MEPEQAESLLNAFRSVPRAGRVRPTFLEISRYPHYENVCSNILEFFLDPQGPHGLGSLCLDALLQALDQPTQQSNVVVEREVLTKAGNKLDLLIESDTHIIGIENKIFHTVSNPFTDYATFLEGLHHEKQKTILKVILSLSSPSPEPGYGFVHVTHAHLVRTIRSLLGFYVREADSHYLALLIDFMTTMENLTRGPQMNTAWLQFILERKEELQALLEQLNAFKAELRTKVKELGSLVDTHQLQNVRQWLWRPSNDLCDVLVHDIRISDDLPVAIDTVISPHGWEIQIFLRRGDTEDLRALLRSLGVEFEEGDHLIYPVRFSYGEPLRTIQPHLQELVDKLAGASIRGAT